MRFAMTATTLRPEPRAPSGQSHLYLLPEPDKRKRRALNGSFTEGCFSRTEFRHNPTMSRTLQKNIRVTPEQWERIENAAKSGHSTANQLVIELALEALDRRKWPRTEHEIRLLRSAMFAAQAIARDMIADGRAEEVEQIRRSISAVVPKEPE